MSATEHDALLAVLALAQHLGVRDSGELPEYWEEQIDAAWWIAVNGQLADVVSSRGMSVPSGTIYVEFNGVPAGIMHILGEGEFAAGTEANPETFAAAIAARCAEEGRSPEATA